MTSAGPDTLNAIAEEFQSRLRAGESPAVEEYAARYPAHAARIRGLFPALVTLEEAGSGLGGPVPVVGAGVTLGEYRIVREIGRGGMGTVYESVQEPLGRTVALKVLSRLDANEAAEERFRREARMASRLHHTNIVPVFGVGAAAGRLYYAMQFIRGHNLATLLGEIRSTRAAASTPGLTRTPPADASSFPTHVGGSYHREVARVGAAVADAIAYAHSQGVLHRDVKPSNIILDETGRPWVTDFGLAKADDADDLTATNDLIGTLRYMSPERFEGTCGPGADVFGLGATLYELLVTRPAFDGTTRAELLTALRKCEPVPLRQLDRSIPADLATVVETAMARDLAGRYPDAAAFADDLRRVLDDRPIKARRPGPFGRLRRWAIRNPTVAGISTAFVVLLVSFLTATAWQNESLRRSVADREKALDAEKEAVSEGKRLLRQSYVDQAALARTTGRPGQRTNAFSLLDKAAGLADGPDLLVARFEAGTKRDLVPTPLTDGDRRDRFDHSLRYGASSGVRVWFHAWPVRPSTVWKRELFDRLPELPGLILNFFLGRSFPKPDPGEPPRRSPLDARFLLEYRGTPRFVWEFNPGFVTLCGVSVENLFRLRTANHTAWDLPQDSRFLTPSHDGRLAALVRGKGPTRIEVRELATGAVRRSWSVTGEITSLAWSKSDRMLAAGTRDGLLSTWRGNDFAADATVVVAERPVASQGLRSVDFSPDGRDLLVVRDDGSFAIHSPHTANLLIVHPTVPDSTHAKFARSGESLIAWHPFRPGVTLVGAGDFETFTNAPCDELVVSPDGQTLAYRDHKTAGSPVQLWDIPSGTWRTSWVPRPGVRFAGFDDRAGSIREYDVATYTLTKRALVRDGLGVWRWTPSEPVTHFAGPKRAKGSEPGRLHVALNPDEFIIHPLETLHKIMPTPPAGHRDTIYSWPGENPDAWATWTIPSAPNLLFDPSGRWLVAHSNQHVVVLERHTKQEKLRLPVIPQSKWVCDAKGNFAMQLGAKESRIWRTSDWHLVGSWTHEIATGSMRGTFVPGRPEFVIVRDGHMEWRSTEDGRVLFRTPTSGTISELVVTPNGQFLIAAGTALYVWKLSN